VRESAPAFAERFYATLLKEKPLGIPTASQWQKLRSYFSADLVAGIEKAQKEEAAAAKKQPDEPPIYGDGWLFTSLYEGATHFTVGQPLSKGETVRLPVALRYVTGKEETAWSDTLVLKPSGKTWQVAEIEFGGKWAFKSGNGLRQAIGLIH
jgi:hypothetical protein